MSVHPASSPARVCAVRGTTMPGDIVTIKSHPVFSTLNLIPLDIHQSGVNRNTSATPAAAAARNPAATATGSSGPALTTECPRCEQGVRFNGNHPGGGTRCEICDGESAVPLLCECCPTDTAATEWVGGIALCPVCAAAEKVGAFSMAEDVA